VTQAYSAIAFERLERGDSFEEDMGEDGHGAEERAWQFYEEVLLTPACIHGLVEVDRPTVEHNIMLCIAHRSALYYTAKAVCDDGILWDLVKREPSVIQTIALYRSLMKHTFISENSMKYIENGCQACLRYWPDILEAQILHEELVLTLLRRVLHEGKYVEYSILANTQIG